VGLSDRDYMRDRARENYRRELAFRPPSKGMGLPWMILFWIVLAWVLFKVYTAFGPNVRQTGHQNARSVPQHVEPLAPVSRAVEARPTRTEDAARAPSRALSPAPTSPPPQAASETPHATNTIYLCRAYNGGTFWAQAHCNQHNALIERIAYVPPTLPFDQQVAIASQQQRTGAALASTNTVTHQTNQTPSGQQQECKALDAHIANLDAMARQPQSAQVQDWIAGKRKDARDRQFRLRC
jgi:hypothetical protein